MSNVKSPDPAMHALRAAYHAWLDQSPRAAAMGLEWPPLRPAFHAKDTWEDSFTVPMIAPLRFRHRLDLGAASPVGAVDLLIGCGSERVDATLAALTARHPEWARLEKYGRAGVKVMLPVPALSAVAGFTPAVAETVLAWFAVLAEWWTETGAALVPWAVAPTRG